MIILYCACQEKSSRFYEAVLGRKPLLDVPGMTEFEFSGNVLLGIMPNEGAGRLLGNGVPHPSSGNGIPRCEIYIPVADPEKVISAAVSAGAKIINPYAPRNWGHKVAYLSDPDGHILGIVSDR